MFLVVPPIFIGGFSCEERSDEATSLIKLEIFNVQAVFLNKNEQSTLIIEHFFMLPASITLLSFRCVTHLYVLISNRPPLVKRKRAAGLCATKTNDAKRNLVDPLRLRTLVAFFDGQILTRLLPLISFNGSPGTPTSYICLMKLTLYQIDAFTNKLFGGNPAAVIPLDKWIDEDLMQRMGMESNLSDTAFFVKKDDEYEIRWFTPAAEINLCGHATLASAFVLYNILGFDKPKIIFHSKSGPLNIEKRGDLFVMDFPSWKPHKVENNTNDLKEMLGIKNIAGVYKHRDLLIELESEQDVRNADPNFPAIKKRGEKIIITSRANGNVDFVSRFFAPSVGIDEDPVTGSAHSQLIPFWSEKLGKNEMRARQLSKRGGELWVSDRGDRVSIAGECVFYMKGEISLQ